MSWDDGAALPRSIAGDLSATEVISYLYGPHSLSSVFPRAAAQVGVRWPDDAPAPEPRARHAIVVMIDGLGLNLLRRRGGHAPFLRAALPAAEPLAVGFPSSTAISITTLGTATPPGGHGVVGIDITASHQSPLFNTLNWEGGPPARKWQTKSTVFELASSQGVDSYTIGPSFFAGSGLTEASMRGAQHLTGRTFGDRVDAAISLTRGRGPTLQYVYWGELDKVGHTYGCESWQWGDELEAIDQELRRLISCVGRHTSVFVTADHGMVDVPRSHRIDVAHQDALTEGVRDVGGDPRATYVYCHDGEATAVQQRWQEHLGDRADVVLRDELLDAGWAGPQIEQSVAERYGDVIAVMRGPYAVLDSRRMRPELINLIGLHGAASPDELLVPLLTWHGA